MDKILERCPSLGLIVQRKSILPLIYYMSEPSESIYYNELDALQNFEDEHKLDGDKPPIVKIRMILVPLIMTPYLTSFMYWDYHYFLIPFTNWTLIITTIYILTSTFASFNKSIWQWSKAFQAFHHILYTLALMCNFVVMSVYWTILHKDQMREHANEPVVGPGRAFHLKLVHSLPGTLCVINSVLT